MKILLKKIRHAFRICRTGVYSAACGIRYCGFHKEPLEKLRWRMLLLAHSLEKGLGMESGRKDFGVQKARDLMRIVERYRVLSGDLASYEYREAVSVMQEHRLFREKNGLDVSMYQRLDEYLQGMEPIRAGYETLTIENVSYRAEEFEKLCAVRHSVRSFSGEPVTKEELDKAIALMQTAPTACNRQMVKVYCAMDREANRSLARLVPGNTGFEDEADKYLFITADMTAFDDFEVDQWYVNGGICAAFLQLALTAYEIGSCIFQWPKDQKKDQQAREILHIPDNEAVVTVLGIGHYKDEFQVLASARKDASDFIRYI